MLTAPYPLRRTDHKNARFYWMRDVDGIHKYIGITSLAAKVLPDTPELVRWQIQKDPDGRLVELAAEHGTLEHKCIDALDTGLDWQILIPENYPYERMVKGSVLSWRKFLDDYKIEVLASELMLKYVDEKNPEIRFACTLDKVVYITHTEKTETLIETDEVFKSGKRKGMKKLKKVIGTKDVQELAIIDLKSNFFEKDSKTFYEGHEFQLHGQRLAFMQSFPKAGIPNIYNWSPSNFRTRSTGNFDNLYTFHQKTGAYTWKFNWLMELAVRERYMQPQGKIEIFTDFTKDTPIQECYKALTYDEYVIYQEQEELKKLEEQQPEMPKRAEFIEA